MNKNKLLIASVAALFSMQAVAQQTTPVFPGYGNCPIVTKDSQKVIDPNCVADVDRHYQEIMNSYNLSTHITTNTYTGTVAPIQPTYSCKSGADGVDYACENKFAVDKSDYDKNYVAYQTVQQQNANLKQQQDAALNVRLNPTQSVTSTLAEANAGNAKASSTNKTMQYISMAGSAFMFYKAATCMGTCSAPFIVAGVALAVIGMKQGQQAANHDASAYGGCTSLNQLSTAQTNCGAAPIPYSPETFATTGFPGAQLDPVTGDCKPSAPASCITERQKVIDSGVDIKNLAKAPSQFAGPNALFKVNKDGSITTKDGKTYTAADFADEKSMMAAGLSAADAHNLANSLYGKDGVYAKAGLDPKGDLAAANKFDFGKFGLGDGGSMTIKTGADGVDKGAVGSKDLDGFGSGRKPSSSNAGLIKNFNGENIGIANDDIFKMMNKRYNLKTAQDSFISK
ncbi:MAG: hypothetical protein WA160_16515 [Pseudobdellovibrio sp.]